MKILQFINGFHPGGKERRLTELLKYCVSRNDAGMEIVVMSEKIAYPEVLNLGIPIHYLIRKTKKDPAIFGRFFSLCRRLKPDCIHVWDSMTAIYAIPAARLLRIPLINGMIVGAPERIRPFSEAWIRSRVSFPFSDMIVANSRAGLQSYNAPPDKSRWIYNGFDFRRLDNLPPKEEIRRRAGFPDGLMVGMVAEFSHRKDYRTYFQAAEIVLNKFRDVTFVAIGDGPLFNPLKAELSSGRIRNIRFLGWQKDVEAITNCLDIGVLATFTEGISNSILEMMALGKPVVASAGGGTCELIADGVTGFLVPQRDAGAMAEKIFCLLENPGLRESMGQRGAAIVREKFSIERMGEEFTALYKMMLHRHRQS